MKISLYQAKFNVIDLYIARYSYITSQLLILTILFAEYTRGSLISSMSETTAKTMITNTHFFTHLIVDIYSLNETMYKKIKQFILWR